MTNKRKTGLYISRNSFLAGIYEKVIINIFILIEKDLV